MKKSLIKPAIALSTLTLLLASASVVYAEPYGWSPDTTTSIGPAVCTDPKPEKSPILLQPNHSALPKKAKNGEVVLYWHKVPNASGYNIYYGLSPKNYIFSAANLGDTDNFTIGHLGNRTYYFAVQAKVGCTASNLSNEWAVRPGGNGVRSGGVLGARYNPQPVRKIESPLPTNVPENTLKPEVQGISVKNEIPTTKPTVYTPPIEKKAATTQVTPKPKAKNWWEKIIATLFGSK